jgi:hypothetical protein
MARCSIRGCYWRRLKRLSRHHDLLLLLVPPRPILQPWCIIPSTICGGASGTLATNSRISGNGAGTTPRSTAISICSPTQNPCDIISL